MKKIALILSALILSACTTTGEIKPVDIAATVAKVCPPVRSTITLLKVNPAIQPKTLETLNYVEPYIANACNMDIPASATDLRALSEKAIPILVEAIAESDMKPNDKEVAIIALTVAQVALATVQ